MGIGRNDRVALVLPNGLEIGIMDKEGYRFIKARLKEIINRGGEKISPREVDEVLMDHPAVEQAVTFAVAHWPR